MTNILSKMRRQNPLEKSHGSLERSEQAEKLKSKKRLEYLPICFIAQQKTSEKWQYAASWLWGGNQQR